MSVEMKDRVVCAVFVLLLAGGLLPAVFMPKDTYSDSERRMLSPMPGLSVKSVWSGRFMSDFEAYAADTFPFRDDLRRLKALTAFRIFLKQDNNGIYVSDGFLSSIEYPMNDASLVQAAERFRKICQKQLTEENKVYFSIIPDKNCFLAEVSGHLSMDYTEFERRMKELMDFAEYIPISDLLERDDYYRTDTHWRQERIGDVAGRLAQAMGARHSQDYQVHRLKQDFYGVYYGQAALPLAPDELWYMTNESMHNCRVYDWQNNREIPIYDLKKAKGRDPYEMFLSGSISFLTIENKGVKTDRRLVIFRDSFGSSIAPLLLDGYSQITLADIRYIHPDYLSQFIDFNNCDVLFLYSTLVLNHSETLR